MISPYQLIHNKPPTYDHLKIFGFLCCPLFPPIQHQKLQPHSAPSLFLRYASKFKAYKCYDIQSDKYIISRHVTFKETKFPFHYANNPFISQTLTNPSLSISLPLYSSQPPHPLSKHLTLPNPTSPLPYNIIPLPPSITDYPHL